VHIYVMLGLWFNITPLFGCLVALHHTGYLNQFRDDSQKIFLDCFTGNSPVQLRTVYVVYVHFPSLKLRRVHVALV